MTTVVHTCIYAGLVTCNIELHHCRIGDEIYINSFCESIYRLP